MAEMRPAESCPTCGVERTSDAPAGLCPGCLLADALDAPSPVSIGDYDVLELIGRGGMGAIYRAKHRKIGRVVALKVIVAGELATPEEQQRFRSEVEAASHLDHPHIVPIYEVGEHDGRPYFTMRLLASALDAKLDVFRDPDAAAALVATVARAVHHGHERGVLHRDLKPANILLDDRGQPHVTDFGTAKRVGDPGLTEPGVVVGTPMYMAPEQARGGQQETTAVDIYSLGAVLYELLTGRPPFEGDVSSIVQQVLESDPPRPRAIDPTIPRDIETICLKCIEKSPEARYRTAEELAEDLERYTRGEPIAARPAGLFGRAWRVAQRRWLAVGIGVGVIIALAVAAITATTVAQAHETELRRDALRTNAYAARAVAGAVAFQLRERVDHVVVAAADPAIARLLVGGDGLDVLDRHRAHTDFDSLAAFDRDGKAVARSPDPPAGYLGADYSWRDYFIGARRRDRAIGYVSRAFRSEADGRYKFAVSAPVYTAEGTFVGVIMGTIGTDSALGRLQLGDESESRRTAVLVAPRDRARAQLQADLDHVVVLHEGLAHGHEIAIDSKLLRQLRAEPAGDDQLRWIEARPLVDDRHRDPVPGFEGRWLAGFAPVGTTGFVVIVQTRHDAAVEPNVRLAGRLATRVGGATLAWVGLFGLALWAYARARRSRRTKTASGV